MATIVVNPHPSPIVRDGDVLVVVPPDYILSTDKGQQRHLRGLENEFVPPNKFIASSGQLSLMSRYFEVALSDKWSKRSTEDGLVMLFLPGFISPYTIRIILLAMYGISDSLPHLGVTLDAFFDIAIAADFLDIQGGLDRYVQEWILELKGEREIGLPTWKWAVISFVFRHKQIFQWSIKTILEHGLTSWEIDGGPTALLRAKLIELERKQFSTFRLDVDHTRHAVKLLQSHVDRLANGPHYCGEYCDSHYLGLIMIFNKQKILPISRADEDADRTYGPRQVFDTLSEWKERLTGLYCGEKSRASWVEMRKSKSKRKGEFPYWRCDNQEFVLGRELTVHLSKMGRYLASLSPLDFRKEIGL